jgi:hypothetical protein
LTNSSTAIGWDDLISSAVIDEIGLVEVVPGVVIRVPVTCTCSIFAGAASWAMALCIIALMPTSIEPANTPRKVRDIIFS